MLLESQVPNVGIELYIIWYYFTAKIYIYLFLGPNRGYCICKSQILLYHTLNVFVILINHPARHCIGQSNTRQHTFLLNQDKKVGAVITFQSCKSKSLHALIFKRLPQLCSFLPILPIPCLSLFACLVS